MPSVKGEDLLAAAEKLVAAELTNAEIRMIGAFELRATATDWAMNTELTRDLLPRAARTVTRLRKEIADTIAEYQRYLGERDRALGIAIGERNEARDKLAAALRELEHVGKGQDRAEKNEIALHAENLELREEREHLLAELAAFRERP